MHWNQDMRCRNVPIRCIVIRRMVLCFVMHVLVISSIMYGIVHPMFMQCLCIRALSSMDKEENIASSIPTGSIFVWNRFYFPSYRYMEDTVEERYTFARHIGFLRMLDKCWGLRIKISSTCFWNGNGWSSDN